MFRTLLCLIVVSFVVIQTARGVTADIVWNEALMIMLAHYFTSRRFDTLVAGASHKAGSCRCD